MYRIFHFYSFVRFVFFFCVHSFLLCVDLHCMYCVVDFTLLQCFTLRSYYSHEFNWRRPRIILSVCFFFFLNFFLLIWCACIHLFCTFFSRFISFCFSLSICFVRFLFVFILFFYFIFRTLNVLVKMQDHPINYLIDHFH